MPFFMFSANRASFLLQAAQRGFFRGVRFARLFLYPLEDLPVDVVTSAMLRVAWLVECARFSSIQESSSVQMSRCSHWNVCPIGSVDQAWKETLHDATERVRSHFLTRLAPQNVLF